MSYQAIKEYLIAILTRYQQADKKGKTNLLNEAAQVTQLSRKHLIRCLKLPKEELQRKKLSGRRAKYSPELLLPHITLFEFINSRRIKLPPWEDGPDTLDYESKYEEIDQLSQTGFDF